MPRRRALALLLLSLTALAAASPAAATGPGRYRFVVTPIVPLEHDSTGAPAFDVYVRLDRPLPRGRDGAPEAELWLADSGGDQTAVTLGRRSSACYAAGVDPSFTRSRVLRHPRIGAAVKAKLWVDGRLAASRTVHLTHPLKAAGEDQDAPYVRALGC